ncbi:unnamed protein product, partial [Soboliphyme baturini]|uniref:LAM_G_DOMAIN domain-containing protein n=1 Tax=Soboliphyme baturini TaxID=241478 RepID=A0A183IYS5_9BILA
TADSCALHTKPVLQPYSESDEGCYRFGIESTSRLEFEKLPSAIDAKGEFTLAFRASAFSGVLLYATDRNRDFIILYMKNGKLIFSFDSGSGAISLESRRSLLDYQWHQVKVNRTGRKGQLWVNDILEAEGESQGATDRVETLRPFFVGGLPVELYRIAEKQKVVDESVAPIFAGCIKNLRLNDEPLGDPSTAAGTSSCSEVSEEGLYFGENAAYAIVDENFNVLWSTSPIVTFCIN